jgi:hypothetical protein
MFGSGFPKSLDVSKAIDKANGDPLAWRAFSRAYASAVEASPLSHADIDRALGIKSSSCYWAREDDRGGMPPRAHWERVRELLSLPSDFAHLYDEAEREVLSTRPGKGVSSGVYGDFTEDEYAVTTAATDAAHRWQGWGTALKPAHEPIVMARKPLMGTVAQNVLAHGTGGINGDGCRIGADAGWAYPNGRGGSGWGGRESLSQNLDEPMTASAGRWPANVALDEEAVAMLDEQSGELQSGANPARRGSDKFRDVYQDFAGQSECQPARGADAGGASRFFYCAKVSREEREAGCEMLPARSGADAVDRDEGAAGTKSPRAGASRTASQVRNHHPTVKPIELMRWLVRLVTPPGGLVLDPFTGSGSTGVAALLEGFRFIGCELSPEYAEIARARIVGAAPMFHECEVSR